MSDNNNIIDKPILDETGTLVFLSLLSFYITLCGIKLLYDDITNKKFTILQRIIILVISLTAFPSCAYYLILRANKKNE
jgi:hypothetical protein